MPMVRWSGIKTQF